MQVKIGCGHLFTLPIQQLKLYNIWFLNMEHPSHKIMWWMWFQLARILLCTKNVNWDESDFTYVYFHSPCHCVLACWQTSMVANGIGIMYVTKIYSQAKTINHKSCSTEKATGICVTMHRTLLSQEGNETSWQKSIKVLWLIENLKIFFG